MLLMANEGDVLEDPDATVKDNKKRFAFPHISTIVVLRKGQISKSLSG